MSANVQRTVQTEKKRPWLCFGIAFASIFLIFLIVLFFTTPLLDPLRRSLSSPHSFPVAEGVLAVSDDRLICVGENALYVYNEEGVADEYPAAFSAPQFCTCGDRLLVFDADGQSVARLSAGQLPSLSAAEGKLFDASVAASGSYCLLYDTADARAVLEVYRDDGSLCFRHRSKTAFLNTCALSPNAELVAVTALGQRALEFESTLCLYRTDSEAAPVTWTTEGLPYDCGFLSDEALFVASDTGLYLYRADGTLLHSMPEARLLAQGDGTLLAVTDDTVQVLDADGTLLAAATVDEQPKRGALCGEYLALQFNDSLRVYTRDLIACGQLDGGGDFCLCPDGAAWCVEAMTATRYIP